MEELQMIKAASAARNIWERRDRKSKKLARSLQTSPVINLWRPKVALDDVCV